MVEKILAFVLFVLVMAMNYVCYRIGRKRGIDEGTNSTLKIQILAAPDLCLKLKKAVHDLDIKSLSNEQIEKALNDFDKKYFESILFPDGKDDEEG